MVKRWIDSRVLSWNCSYQSGIVLDGEKWQRANLIWEHAKNLIESNQSEFDLADGITNLKRCLNHRLSLIEEIYEFKNIELNSKPKGYMELLERLGIIRPFIMNNLCLIRNDIEHNYARPPSIERCLELLDVIWYFLKSTDPMVQIKKGDVYFEMCDEYGFSLRNNFNNSEIYYIYGSFPTEYVYSEQKDNCFEIILGTFEFNNGDINFKYYNKSNDLNIDKSLSGRALFNDNLKFEVIPKLIFTS